VGRTVDALAVGHDRRMPVCGMVHPSIVPLGVKLVNSV
jgi:hypothetical protein